MADPPQRTLRIALCHPDLGIGGAERLVVDAATELASIGHHVHIFTAHYDKNRCFDETKDGRFAITVYGDFLPRHVFYKLHALCAYIRCIYVAICMVIFWQSFDVIMVDQVSAIIPIFKCTSSKIVFYCHFPDLLLAQHTSWSRRLYRKPIDWIEEKTTGMADSVLVNSQFTASIFKRTFQSLHAIQPAILYPAVNIEQFTTDVNVPTGTQKCFFLSINRFERKKNIGLAISAFALLVHHISRATNSAESSLKNSINGKNLNLVVAGGYDERLCENREYLQELKQLVQEKGISELVEFFPSCTTKQRDDLLATCLCVIYTPMDEHFGIVPLEAMASQKPVIACNSGGPKESIVHNVTGFLCEPTSENFSSAMKILYQHQQLAETMGKSARDHVEANFSRQTFGRSLNGIILNVLNADRS